MGVCIGILLLSVLSVAHNSKVSFRRKTIVQCISKKHLKSLTSSTSNEEIRFHNLRGYDKRHNEILVFIAMNKCYNNISYIQKTQTQSTIRCYNHYHYHHRHRYYDYYYHTMLKLSLKHCISLAHRVNDH